MVTGIKNCAIVWFRRDLRLADNPALTAALERGFDEIVPVYIYSPVELEPWPPGGAQRVWLHFSLAALDKDLRSIGSRLIIRPGSTKESTKESTKGSTQDELNKLIHESGATAVYWNRLYEPQVVERDKRIKSSLNDDDIEADTFNAALLNEPWRVSTTQGEPYKVFTPYWKKARAITLPTLFAAPDKLPAISQRINSLSVSDLDLLPRISWDKGIRNTWRPGEQGAHERLEIFFDDVLNGYAGSRDQPGVPGTSYLSPHLHFGEIGPRQILHKLDRWLYDSNNAACTRDAERFRSEIGWREFAHHVLYHFPDTPEQPMDLRFNSFPWVDSGANSTENGSEALQRWKRGQTGIPMVDAGMRELWTTGYMHNRLRMTVASFLTKNLRLRWQEGARWFWDTLVDADLANNTMGWQWAAGCGADAAPFFRIFNPVRQGERFDPNGHYVRRWVPELSKLPDKYIHCPWSAPAMVLEAAGVTLGKTYPEPMVDLKISRQKALEAFDKIKKQ